MPKKLNESEREKDFLKIFLDELSDRLNQTEDKETFRTKLSKILSRHNAESRYGEIDKFISIIKGSVKKALKTVAETISDQQNTIKIQQDLIKKQQELLAQQGKIIEELEQTEKEARNLTKQQKETIDRQAEAIRNAGKVILPLLRALDIPPESVLDSQKLEELLEKNEIWKNFEKETPSSSPH